MKARRVTAAGLLFPLLLFTILATARCSEPDADAAAPTALPTPTAAAAAGAGRPHHPDERQTTSSRTAADDGARASHRIEVFVVTTDGNPAAGATVRFWPERTQGEHERDDALQQRTQDHEAALAETGRSCVTDAGGVVWIEASILDPVLDSPLVARRGDLFATWWIRACDEKLQLELRRDVCLDIEVVDTLGHPRQGQVVGLETECLSRRRGLDRSAFTTNPTDASGRVRVPHAQMELGLATEALAGRLVARCERRTWEGSELLTERSVDLRGLTSSLSLRLVVPAGGSLGVRVTDADGARVFARTWICDERGKTVDRSPAEHDDRAWFHGLPLARRWTVVVRAGGANDTRIPVTGPVAVGEAVTVDIPGASRWWRFLAHLRRDDGAPVPRAEVECHCAELPEPATCSSGSSGELSATLNSFPPDIAEVTRLELRVKSPLAADKVFRFDGKYAPGKHDLGTLVVAPPRDERRLASVEVRCDGESIAEEATVRLLTRSPATHDLEEPPCAQRRDGNRIEILGVPPARPLQLDITHRDCADVRIPIAVGEYRVVDLRRAAGLRLAVVPPEVAWGSLVAELQCLDAAGDPATASLDCDAQTFDWRGIVPGRYRLRIEAFGREIHQESELRLLAGSNTWPSDGSRLDLRGRMRTFCIAAHSADDPGQSPLHVDSLVVPAGTDLPENADQPAPADNTFAPWPTAAELLVRKHGFVPVRVHDPRSDVVLALQPLTRLEFPTNPATEIRIHVVADGVHDPMLRAFDTCNRREAETDTWTSNELVYAPGTELDICVLRDGKPGPTQRVIIGAASHQSVVLR